MLFQRFFTIILIIIDFPVAKYRTTKALVSLKGSWTEQILLKEKLNIKEKMRNIKVKYVLHMCFDQYFSICF